MKVLNIVERTQISAEISLTITEISMIVKALEKGFQNGVFGTNNVLESMSLISQFKDIDTVMCYNESKLNPFEDDI